MFAVLFLQFFFIFTKANEIPSYVHVCKRNLPDFTECLKNTAHELLPYLGKGIPEMGLLPIDPLKISNITTHIGVSSINMNFQVTNITVYHLSKFTVSNFFANLDIGRFTASLFFENMEVEGHYVLQGRVLAIALDGNGLFTLNATGISVLVEWFGNTVTKKDDEYLIFTDAINKVNIKHMQLQVYDLFKGNDALTETVNKIINDNIQELKNDFDLVLQKLIGDISLDYVNGLYSKFPLSVLFPLD